MRGHVVGVDQHLFFRMGAERRQSEPHRTRDDQLVVVVEVEHQALAQGHALDGAVFDPLGVHWWTPSARRCVDLCYKM
ncbi:hypothetical protein A5729_20150 [Mycobacterium vulneris]|nr:hypothetical protein A5729_20150 [Mycolicibacterium vulneris]